MDYKGIVSELWNTTIDEGHKDEEPVYIYIYILQNSLVMLYNCGLMEQGVPNKS